MTIIAPIEGSIVSVNGTNGVSSMLLHKHWGSKHSVQVYREPNKSLGISIVGGKVSLIFNNVGRYLYIYISFSNCHTEGRYIYCKSICFFRFVEIRYFVAKKTASVTSINLHKNVFFFRRSWCRNYSIFCLVFL